MRTITKRRFVESLTFTLLLYPAQSFAKQDCPAGQEREIKEVIVKPAIVEDIYGKIGVFKSNSTRERVWPAKIEWVDIPDGYVRPENITDKQVYKFAATYKPTYTPYVFRESSSDELIKLDGARDIKYVPSIWAQKITYAIDPKSASSRVESVTIPYDPSLMEKDGKLLRVIKPRETEFLNNSLLTKERAIIRQTRTSAVLKEVWGDCLIVK